jgi:26S proteasome regulatory subunit N3
MADKMDIDAVNGEKQAESAGPAPTLSPEKSAFTYIIR